MHLTDCFMELVAYIAYFKRTAGTQQTPYDQVKADVHRLLAQSEGNVKKGLFSQDDYDQARFMVCAWVDEVILGSEWKYKSQWQKEQLQRLHYNTADAGEEAFNRLNVLGPHQREVREVYYLCLALGFMGRYINKGDEYLLDQVKTSNLKLLLGSSMGLPSLEGIELFPEVFPAEVGEISPSKRRFQVSPFTLLCIAGPPVLMVVLFFIYRFALSGIGADFAMRVP